jgi:hypothetical protein
VLIRDFLGAIEKRAFKKWDVEVSTGMTRLRIRTGGRYFRMR